MSAPTFFQEIPEQISSCLVFSSPHSGREYPSDFLESARLDARTLRNSEDAFVDRLIAQAPRSGAPLLMARYPRAFLDLNRAADELDPAIIEGAGRHAARSVRVAAGLGVIPRVVSEGQVIRDGKIPLHEALERIQSYHAPFHARLAALLQSQRRRFGMAVLMDCHSMPHSALAGAPKVRGRTPDVVLGDRYGAACDRWITAEVQEALIAEGFTVASNAPFAGGYITQTYGRPGRSVHALQIEIDRALYMDEARIEPLPAFGEIRDRLSRVIAVIAHLGQHRNRVAAE